MDMKAYEILVNQVIEKLEQWVVPWKQSWIWGIPCNYVTNKSYRWFNRLILSMNEFSDNRYLTFKQIVKLWWKIKKWSKSTRVYYYQLKEKDVDDETINIPITKYYNVFNIEQTTWIKYQTRIVDIDSDLTKTKSIVDNYIDKPIIQNWIMASYDVTNDIITIPLIEKFKSSKAYFSTLFHELIHSTWSKARLNRIWLSWIEYYWTDNYSKEELVAEMGAMFLCMEGWILNDTKEESISYINWWLNYIKWNKKHLINASILAEKAVDYILWYHIAKQN